MATQVPTPDSPRAVADKRSKRRLLAAIRMALRVESPALRHNTQSFNRNRYVATAAIPDYDELKDRARAIKEQAIARLPELLQTLETSVRRNGGHFYLANDGADASRYVAEVCTRARVRSLVKGKSMTSEEIGLNHVLEAAGIEVAETDLAEFILQVADEQPSHIVAPAVHYSRERITELFARVFHPDEALDTGEDLTRFAREKLREKFLRADAGITGANMIAADSGTLMLVESEANIRMTAIVPPLHIAITGIEKIVPTRADLATFVELIAASGTGQPMTSYTSIISPPLKAPVLGGGEREFHLVLVDNGRMKMRDDPVLQEALYCVRCSACLNSCANFQTVGGHAFGGETYSGGIGGAWEAGTRTLENARFAELCTGCTRCVNQCPVRIDIPWLNSVLRQRLNQHDAKPAETFAASALDTPLADRGAPLQKLFFGRYDLAGKWGSRVARLANAANRLTFSRALLEKTFGLDRRRQLPPFASETLQDAAARWRKQTPAPSAPIGRVALFPDIFTNYGSPARGLATLKVLRAIGVDVEIAPVSADGRAALSQGLIATAAEQARHTADVLRPFLDSGREILVVEPSALAMFRLDNRHFLPPREFERLRDLAFEPVEYLWKLLAKMRLDVAALFPAARHPRGRRVFYHSHCQQKTIGAAAPTEAVLRAAGFDVVTSRVECCGMAGSFGYKKEYFELAMAVGEDLFGQVAESERDGERTLVASGTSCQEQLHAGLGRAVLHPMELLAEIVQSRD